MHGLGNDFVVIDGIRQVVSLTRLRIQQWGNRHSGIGFDQLLLVERPRNPEYDFRYRIFNNDGEEVEQCGNGARCFARFVKEQGLTDKTTLNVETMKGSITLHLLDDQQVLVNMGIPEFTPQAIPFLAEHESIIYTLSIPNDNVPISVVSLGNPHAVITVDNIETAPVTTVGPLIEAHERFPERVNVGFMKIHSRHHISLRVYERGAGETLSCGSGACAAVIAGIRRDIVDTRVRVQTRGGDLTIEWKGPGNPVYMIGPAHTTFIGEIDS